MIWFRIVQMTWCRGFRERRTHPVQRQLRRLPRPRALDTSTSTVLSAFFFCFIFVTIFPLLAQLHASLINFMRAWIICAGKFLRLLLRLNHNNNNNHNNNIDRRAMEDHLAWRNGPDGASSADNDWGVLFDDDGIPEKRVEEVLVGLGDYISRTVLPDGIGLITPHKMSWLFKKFRIHAEDDTLISLFTRKHESHKERCKRLQDLFESLNCRFEMGPEKEPNGSETSTTDNKVPCLLCKGFAAFMITLIRANPDREAKRFAKIARTMPFRIPKVGASREEDMESPNVLSRHLFPRVRDVTSSAKFDVILLRVTRAVEEEEVKGKGKEKGKGKTVTFAVDDDDSGDDDDDLEDSDLDVPLQVRSSSCVRVRSPRLSISVSPPRLQRSLSWSSLSYRSPSPVLVSAGCSYSPNPLSTYQPSSPLSLSPHCHSPHYPPPLSPSRPHYLGGGHDIMPDASKEANLFYIRGGHISDDDDDDDDYNCNNCYDACHESCCCSSPIPLDKKRRSPRRQEISFPNNDLCVLIRNDRRCHRGNRLRSSERL
ncbi:hypothetical protein B0T19DRAFT_255576 [Cercophora scortea]|uniref:DUF7514 domain-containing protein n=1 Tax=Cercophora scortea TaxID=314031 RepID=A0AAE0M747_9PEZI|nr:hypothetical protein B0T19DRAFT_255576 [Cercophora scortea]